MLYTAAKLVRDKIPEIIKGQGKACNTVVLSDEDYKKAVKKKILEEADELFQAKDKQSKMEELADLYEILDAFCEAEDISKEGVEDIKEAKAAKKGKFKEKIYLETYEK